MTGKAGERIRQEWRQNARLRWGALVVVLILGARAVLGVTDERAEISKQYERDAELFARLDATARETAWPQRAREAEKARDMLVAQVPEARNEGAARADLQAWLARLGADAVVDQPSVQVETVLDVPGYPEFRQAVGRITGTVATPLDVAPFARGLAAGLPWVQAEQFEIEPGTPVRVSAIVRAYYRRPGPASMTPAAPTDAGAPAMPATPAGPPDDSSRTPAAPAGDAKAEASP